MVCCGAVIVGTPRAEMFTSPKLVSSATRTTLACCLVVSPPIDKVSTFSLEYGIDPSWLAKAWVIKDHWAPSSNKILAWILMSPTRTEAIAVFKRYMGLQLEFSTLLVVAVRPETGWLGMKFGAVGYNELCGDDDWVSCGFEIWPEVGVSQRLVWCFLWYLLHQLLELQCEALCWSKRLKQSPSFFTMFIWALILVTTSQ